MAQQTVLLDTCMLINLLASGESEAILKSATRRWMICAAVEKESIYLRTDDPSKPSELVTLAPLVAKNLLSVCNVESDDEKRLYINYAVHLDDGEAMSVALAVARGTVLATDERKAKRLFLEAVAAPERLTGTSQIMKDWADEDAISTARITHALMQVVNRARYFPPATDLLYRWWSDLCA